MTIQQSKIAQRRIVNQWLDLLYSRVPESIGLGTLIVLMAGLVLLLVTDTDDLSNWTLFGFVISIALAGCCLGTIWGAVQAGIEVLRPHNR